MQVETARSVPLPGRLRAVSAVFHVERSFPVGASKHQRFLNLAAQRWHEGDLTCACPRPGDDFLEAWGRGPTTIVSFARRRRVAYLVTAPAAVMAPASQLPPPEAASLAWYARVAVPTATLTGER